VNRENYGNGMNLLAAGISMFRCAFPLIAASALAACTSYESGAIDPDTMQFQRGVATEQQVAARLGPPSATSFQDNGVRIDIYTYAYAAPDPHNFIPIIAFMDGGEKIKTTLAWYSFNRSGVLTDYKDKVNTAEVRSRILD
jgi:hypothetical protein